MDQKVYYRNFIIYYSPMFIPSNKLDWAWVHKDFDGAPDANDSRYGHAENIEAAKAEIDEFIEDLEA